MNKEVSEILISRIQFFYTVGIKVIKDVETVYIEMKLNLTITKYF